MSVNVRNQIMLIRLNKTYACIIYLFIESYTPRFYKKLTTVMKKKEE